jgi:HPt (histidine-containing phosphotransfer) domain-containing protein
VTLELDKAGILANLMDDEDLLFESIDIFLDSAAERLVKLEAGVVSKDAQAVMEEGHTLKGIVSYFTKEDCFEAAKKLEVMGRNKELDGVEEAFSDFKAKLAELIEALKAWRDGK